MHVPMLSMAGVCDGLDSCDVQKVNVGYMLSQETPSIWSELMGDTINNGITKNNLNFIS